MRILKIAVVSINYKDTPIEIREKFNFTESLKIEAGDYLLDRSVDELVIISTCNRSEVYIASENIDEGIKDVIDMLENFFEIPNTENYLNIERDEEAVIHLYMVASGLDSAVLGEDQILGQVNDAIQTSMKLGFSKKVLNRLFMQGLNEGKKIRTEIKISEVPLSTSYIGINLIKEKLRTLKGKKALIIGAGEISKLAIQYLVEEDLDKIYVTNRTHGRIKEVFKHYEELIPIEYKDRYKVLEDVDVLITATGAPHTIVEAKKVKHIDRSLCILDLALPRDVEEGVLENKNINLIQLDDLNKMSKENLEKREKLSEKALEIIKCDVEEFMLWLENTKVDPVLKSLNSRCKDIKTSRMDYLNRKLNLSSRESKVIEATIDSALRELIREPIKTLKAMNGRDRDTYIEATKGLFRFD